jgi:hypothetical protein
MLFVRGTAWIGDGGDEYWAQNQSGVAEVQRSDENEVHIGVRVGDSESDDASLYLTVAEASRLAHMLGIACLAHEAAAHEAAKF